MRLIDAIAANPPPPEQGYIDQIIAAIAEVDRVDRSDFYVQAFVIASEGAPVAVMRWTGGDFERYTRTELIAEWASFDPPEGRAINGADNEWADAPRTMPHEVWPVHVARAVLAAPVVDGWRRDAETLAKVRAIVTMDPSQGRPAYFRFAAIADLLAGES